jgi:hypothetical protein
MASFAVNLAHLLQRPDAVFPETTNCYCYESTFLKNLAEVEDLEPKADCATKVTKGNSLMISAIISIPFLCFYTHL